MKNGPDLARIAALVGDPARANMLTALMGGTALTASELAMEAGVSLPTASSHLAKLGDGGLVTVASQGRHRYYGLAGPQVAAMLEAIMGVADAVGPKRARPGPKDGAMRQARICYDHLAGEMGVALYDRLSAAGLVCDGGQRVSEQGRQWFEAFGIDVGALARSRRPLCKACLDWSVRRSHLAGSLGAAMLEQFIQRRWARREKDSRVIAFSPQGRQQFDRMIVG
jgi:DNA-binding transcriptional ArsR family regulator